MEKTNDDFEAAGKIYDILKDFKPEEQQQIIKWTSEKLGIQTGPVSPPVKITENGQAQQNQPERQRTDIKTFVESKNPTSDMQLATVVAYFYEFEASDTQHKDSITHTDLQEACRLSGRKRLAKPDQTLRNACNYGFLDKAGASIFKVSTVGENLVAVTLPNNEEPASSQKKRKTRKKISKKTSKKKKISKK